jgi:hypothetical protein
MKAYSMFVIGLVVGLGAIIVPRLAGFDLVRHLVHHLSARSGAPLAHAESKFEFVANASLERVAPLMGADRERAWAPGWDPHFIHPAEATDRQGMVFTVAHGHRQAAWVNTEFDAKAGRMQYVYVIPDTLVTVITIHLTPRGDKTHIAVEYDRTALGAEANQHVQHLAESDRKAGPEWERQINQYLLAEK